MKVHKCFQVDIRDSVSIREVEVLAVKVRFHAFQASAGHGFRACVHQRHFPGLSLILVNLHLVLRTIKCNVTRLEIIIRKVALNDVPTVPAADHEIMHPTGGVHLHDMPKNGLASDFNHRLRPEITLLTDPGTHASCKNHGLHYLSFAPSMAVLTVPSRSRDESSGPIHLRKTTCKQLSSDHLPVLR